MKLTQPESVYGVMAYALHQGYFIPKETDTRQPIEIASDIASTFCLANGLGRPNLNYEKRVVIPEKPLTGDKSDAAPIFENVGFQGE